MITPTSLRGALLLFLITGAPIMAHAQGQCCVCTASGGTNFKVPAQGGSNVCSTACAASGGNATGSTTACYQGSASYPAAKYDGPTQCMKSIDGGNCRGNNWG